MPQQPQQHSPLPPPPPPPPPSSSSSIRPNSTEGITKRPKRRLQVGEDHHGVGTHNSTTIATGAKITTSGWEITSELTTTGASRYEKYDDPEYYYSLYPSQQQQQQQHQLNHRTTSRAYRYNSRRPWHHPQDSGQFTDDYEEDLSGVSLFEMPRLNDFHVRYRKALHVPDNHYREYLQRMDEQTSKSVSSTGGASYTMSSTKGTWVNSTCCAQSCAVFSAIAVLFLFMIGIILDTQPLYIKGCLPYQVITANERGKTTIRYTVPPLPHRLPAAAAAYQAGWAYLATLLISLYVLYPGWFRSQLYRRIQQYTDIPDTIAGPATNITASSSSGNISTSNNYHLSDSSRRRSRRQRPNQREKNGLFSRFLHSPTATMAAAAAGGGGGGIGSSSFGPRTLHEEGEEADEEEQYFSSEVRVLPFHRPTLWNRGMAMTRQWLTDQGWLDQQSNRHRRKHNPKTI